MIITASDDKALLPSMADGMEKHFDSLTKKLVHGTHWALWQVPDEVNTHLAEVPDPCDQHRVRAKGLHLGMAGLLAGRLFSCPAPYVRGAQVERYVT